MTKSENCFLFLTDLNQKLYISELGILFQTYYQQDINFSRQSLQIFTFRVKLRDTIFFLLGLSPIVKLI